MDRKAQLVYEGSRTFRKYGFTIEIVMINLFKYGLFEILIRDQESQCAVNPIYLKASIIEERIDPADMDTYLTNSRHLFDPDDLMNDDEVYDLIVRCSLFNYVADRLSIIKRAENSAELYEVEYVPLLYDPEFGHTNYLLNKLIYSDPYLKDSPEKLAVSDQCAKRTVLNSSIETEISTQDGEKNRNRGRTVSITDSVSIALRTLQELFQLPRVSNSVAPDLKAPVLSTNENQLEDISDRAVHQEFIPWCRSSKSGLFVESAAFEGATAMAPTTGSEINSMHPPRSHISSEGLPSANMRLEDLSDIPDELLGTVIYLTPAKSKPERFQSFAEQRLHPLPRGFKSIDDLCDPEVIERIPDRKHPVLHPIAATQSLSVNVCESRALTVPPLDSIKTETYQYDHSVAPLADSPCMSINEDEYVHDAQFPQREPVALLAKVTKPTKNATTNSKKDKYALTDSQGHPARNRNKPVSTSLLQRVLCPVVHVLRAVVLRGCGAGDGRVGIQPAVSSEKKRSVMFENLPE